MTVKTIKLTRAALDELYSGITEGDIKYLLGPSSVYFGGHCIRTELISIDHSQVAIFDVRWRAIMRVDYITAATFRDLGHFPLNDMYIITDPPDNQRIRLPHGRFSAVAGGDGIVLRFKSPPEDIDEILAAQQCLDV